MNEKQHGSKRRILVYSGITPFDTLDMRIRKAMDASSVRRISSGVFRATTPALDGMYGEGATRKDALSDLWEWCRWMLADPVLMSFEAAGENYTAEIMAEREGGYSVQVRGLPGCLTCGDTMEEVRTNVIEAVEGWLECQHDFQRATA